MKTLEKIFVGVLVLMTLACAAPRACRAPVAFRDGATRTVVESSLRVVIFCGDAPAGFGSAVALGPRRAETAAHVVLGSCPGGTSMTFRAVTWDGEQLALEVGEVDEARDLAEVRPASGADDFPAWAQVGPSPSVGDDLLLATGHFVYAENLSASWTLKRGVCSGTVTYEGRSYVIFSGHVVHGNSGAGVFDSAGRVVGIVSKANDDPDNENVGLVVPLDGSSALRDDFEHGVLHLDVHHEAVHPTAEHDVVFRLEFPQFAFLPADEVDHHVAERVGGVEFEHRRIAKVLVDSEHRPVDPPDLVSVGGVGTDLVFHVGANEVARGHVLDRRRRRDDLGALLFPDFAHARYACGDDTDDEQKTEKLDHDSLPEKIVARSGSAVESG